MYVSNSHEKCTIEMVSIHLQSYQYQTEISISLIVGQSYIISCYKIDLLKLIMSFIYSLTQIPNHNSKEKHSFLSKRLYYHLFSL